MENYFNDKKSKPVERILLSPEEFNDEYTIRVYPVTSHTAELIINEDGSINHDFLKHDSETEHHPRTIYQVFDSDDNEVVTLDLQYDDDFLEEIQEFFEFTKEG